MLKTSDHPFFFETTYLRDTKFSIISTFYRALNSIFSQAYFKKKKKCWLTLKLSDVSLIFSIFMAKLLKINISWYIFSGTYSVNFSVGNKTCSVVFEAFNQAAFGLRSLSYSYRASFCDRLSGFLSKISVTRVTVVIIEDYTEIASVWIKTTLIWAGHGWILQLLKRGRFSYALCS